jgi:hypothetical protein
MAAKKIDYPKEMERIKKEQLAKKNKPDLEKEDNFNFGLITADELQDMKFMGAKWLVENLVPIGGITIIAAPAGNYKSWLMLLMAKCIAKGEKFLDMFECGKAGVFIVDEENKPRQINERMKKLEFSRGLPISFWSHEGFSVSKGDKVSLIFRICKEKNIGVIFFDSLVRISEAVENDANQMAQVFKVLNSFCREGITVIIAHHERKEGQNPTSAQNRMRGSSDISAAIDSHLAVRKNKESGVLEIEQAKNRFEEELETFEVQIINNEEKIEFKYLGKQLKQDQRKNQVEGMIINILKENPTGKLKGDLLEEVKIATGIGIKTIRNILNGLIVEKVVIEKQAEKNKKVCLLALQTSDDDANEEVPT